MRHRLLAFLFAVLCACAAGASAAGSAEPAFDAADIQAEM